MAFGENVDYAQMHKIYGASGEAEGRYSPATCIGCDMKTVIGKPGLRACQHVIRGAPEPHDAHVDAPVHAADERILKEDRKPRPRSRAALHALQLLQSSQDTASDARDGSWYL